MATIAIIGTGYVGLTTGACLAHFGHKVTCHDIDEEKIEDLRQCVLPIFEPGLEGIVKKCVNKKLLAFTSDVSEALSNAQFVFLCLPTPENIDGSADMSYVNSALQSISTTLQPGTILISKSTVPVGTARSIQSFLNRADLPIVSNPEFLKEGSAVADFLKPDRVVIGSDNHEAARVVASLYEELNTKVIITDSVSAEAIKYVSNAYLATRLCFINSVADLCEAVGASIDDVTQGMGADHRIGHDFLRPGPGWGGSCFPKDIRALLAVANQAGCNFDLLREVVELNEAQFDRMVTKIRRACGGHLQGKKVAIWGLTFKAGTNDLRNSPAISIIGRLQKEGASIAAFDPTVVDSRSLPQSGIEISLSPTDAAMSAHAIAVLTEWNEFRHVDPSSLITVMQQAQVVDTRNLLDADKWRKAGFSYQGVGR